jgi:hypothetical protein
MPWTYLDVEKNDVLVSASGLVQDGCLPGVDRFEIHAIIRLDPEVLTGNGEI